MLKVAIRIVFYQKNNLERLERGNLRLGGTISGISCGCRCNHSRQNIFCDQKLANARILSLTDRQTFDQRNTFCKDFFDYKLYFPSICILFEF